MANTLSPPPYKIRVARYGNCCAKKLFKLSELMPIKVCDERDFLRITGLMQSDCHQGVAAQVRRLDNTSIHDLKLRDNEPIVLLDRVCDPHNIGAILRSAAAFNCRAVIAPLDGSPSESAAMAKSSVGAIEKIPYIRVTNLVRIIEYLQQNDYIVLALTGDSATDIVQHSAMSHSKVAFVFGNEGSGLRHLVGKRCDDRVKITINNMESLNVSNAVAITLHQYSSFLLK